jgi:hypothetical protein
VTKARVHDGRDPPGLSQKSRRAAIQNACMAGDASGPGREPCPRMDRPRELMIPVVRVSPRPKGFPMARTFCPPSMWSLEGLKHYLLKQVGP